ncbi:MAG: hypothetical protein JXR07_10845 [Reichenbachiella sp.]
MQKLVLPLLIAVTTGLFSNTYAQKSKVEGTYSYIATNKYEHDRTGMIEITKSDSKYTVVISPDEGTPTNLTDAKVSKNVVTGYMPIEGDEIEISMKIEKDTILGTALLPDGTEYRINAKRKKK